MKTIAGEDTTFVNTCASSLNGDSALYFDHFSLKDGLLRSFKSPPHVTSSGEEQVQVCLGTSHQSSNYDLAIYLVQRSGTLDLIHINFESNIVKLFKSVSTVTAEAAFAILKN